MKKILYCMVLIISVFSIQACTDEKGKGFIGEWVQVSNEKYPSIISIRKEGGIFLVDIKKYDIKKAESKHNEDTIKYFSGESKKLPDDDVERNCGAACYKVIKSEAVAASKSLLKGDSISLRLESGHLYFDSEDYKLVKR